MKSKMSIGVMSALIFTSAATTAQAGTLDEAWNKLNELWGNVEVNRGKSDDGDNKHSTGILSHEGRITDNEANIATHTANITDINADIIAVNARIDAVNADLQAQITVLETAIAALTAPPPVDPEDPPIVDAGAPCFSFDNKLDDDKMGNNWLNTCIEKAGTTFRVVLKDSSGAEVYSAEGAKGDWRYNHITDTNTLNQENISTHAPILLDTGDTLTISGQDSDPAETLRRCGTSHANGYGIVIHGAVAEGSTDAPKAKLMVLPYTYQVGTNKGLKRAFVSWTAGHEITYNMAGFDGCLYGGPNGLIDDGFIGTFEMYVD